jgi:hypothetical protein
VQLLTDSLFSTSTARRQKVSKAFRFRLSV